MTTTALFIGTFVVLQAVQWAANALFLQWGGRWAGAPATGFRRALWAIVASTLVTWILCVPLFLVLAVQPGRIVLGLSATLYVLLSLGLTWFIIARVLETSLWRAIAAWLATLVPNAGYFLLVMFVVNPYLFEAFKIPTNSMAPTILGVHWEAPCPRCGSPAYATPEPDYRMPSNEPVLMICSRELRSCKVVDPPHEKFSGDRLVVSKFIHPQRWDIIVFRYPENPETNYCKRLVGLPGETVVIRDGAVWINGEKQSPPDSCNGLEYLSHIDGMVGMPVLWGSEKKPVRLGPNEYFVLGDFSARAKDSRLWQQGAPGHPPYAVPASYLVGVVTHIYWPPSRCRVLR